MPVSSTSSQARCCHGKWVLNSPIAVPYDIHRLPKTRTWPCLRWPACTGAVVARLRSRAKVRTLQTARSVCEAELATCTCSKQKCMQGCITNTDPLHAPWLDLNSIAGRADEDVHPQRRRARGGSSCGGCKASGRGGGAIPPAACGRWGAGATLGVRRSWTASLRDAALLEVG